MSKEDQFVSKEDKMDETQIVSLHDLEELERLQLAGTDRGDLTQTRRSAVPLGVGLGLLAAALLLAVLAFAIVHRPVPATAGLVPAGRALPGGGH